MFGVAAGLVAAFVLGWVVGGARFEGRAGSGGNRSAGPSSASGQASPGGGLPGSGLPRSTVSGVPIARFSCPRPTVQVSTQAQLTDALAAAGPGTVIRLADGVYSGTFTARRAGTAGAPTYLCGGPGAVLDGGSVTGGYVLHLDGVAHWRISGFTVRNGQKGIMLDGATDVGLQDLTVRQIGDEAVHLRRNSSGNVVRGLTISGTGLRRDKFGEGVYIGSAESNWCEITGCQPDHSDRNVVIENTISGTTSENVDIKEGTSGGILAGNSFNGNGLSAADSWVDVKGNGWLITGNHGTSTPKDGFQTHVVAEGWGEANLFSRNVAELRGGSGVGFYLHHEARNQVECGNQAPGAAELSNHPCTGTG
jgi:hypothetical protein